MGRNDPMLQKDIDDALNGIPASLRDTAGQQ